MASDKIVRKFSDYLKNMFIISNEASKHMWIKLRLLQYFYNAMLL